MKIVLASSSPYRRAQLERIGLTVHAEDPGVDEERVKTADLPPQALAEKLAELKAKAVAARFPEAAVIAGDQLVELGGRVLGKPQTEERALEQLVGLAGKQHTLITAMVVALQGDLHRHTDVTRLTMRSLDRPALARYVQADQPLDCAGSYKLEARGIVLFERIESADHSAITGLPLMALVSILRSLGCAIP